MAQKTDTQASYVRIDGGTGYSVVASNTPLKRLHYFDGKFLRAPDMQLEQQAMLKQIRLSNMAAGPGVIYGYDCAQGSGDNLLIGAGLAYDANGRALYLLNDITVEVEALLSASREQVLQKKNAQKMVAKPAREHFDECEVFVEDGKNISQVTQGEEFYVVTLSHVEAYCGQEDVYGKLCEEACVDSQQRPYIIEGVVIRLEPLSLRVPLPHSPSVTMTSQHLRSRLASAYFESERLNPSSQISASGLKSGIWCAGADVASGNSLAIALLARSGGTTRFVDGWAARRERMASPAAHYWAGHLAMRSWNIFLAQLLQFQCQLSGCFAKAGGADEIAEDPCADERAALRKATESIQQLLSGYLAEKSPEGHATTLDQKSRSEIEEEVKYISRFTGKQTLPTSRMLINCGIVELPSAGYLPVQTGSAKSINEQVRRMMGEGVDLRFCVVRHDYIPHAQEKAQHMERISLLQGLDNPGQLEEVDILVPDGVVEPQQVETPGTAFEMNLCMAKQQDQDKCLQAAANYEKTKGDGLMFAFAGSLPDLLIDEQNAFAENSDSTEAVNTSYAANEAVMNSSGAVTDSDTNLWFKLHASRDPFTVSKGKSCSISLELVCMLKMSVNDKPVQIVYELSQQGVLIVDDVLRGASVDEQLLRCRIDMNGVLTKKLGADGQGDLQQSQLRRTGEVLLRLRPGDIKPALTIRLDASVVTNGASNSSSVLDADLMFELIWMTPSSASFSVSIIAQAVALTHMSPVKQVPLFRGEMRVNPKVRQPGNSYHDTALLALNEIGEALGNSQFEDIRSRLLFPPALPVSDELKVYGVRDWVLFKRRRDLLCTHQRKQEPDLKVRRYRLYFVGDVASKDELASLHQALSNNDLSIIKRFAPEFAGVVEFAPGLASITTPGETIRHDWRVVVDDASTRLMYGAIGSYGDVVNEGRALAQLRLNNVTRVLGAVTTEDDEAQFYVLPTSPETLKGINSDGVIVLASIVDQVATETVCHRVFRVDMQLEQVDNFEKILRVDYNVALERYKAQELGCQPKFVSGTANLSGDNATQDLQSSWTVAGNTQPEFVFNLTTMEAAGSPITPQPYEEQGRAIAAVVNGVDIDGRFFGVTQTTGDCAGITILVTTPQVQLGYIRAYGIGLLNATGSEDALRKTVIGDIKSQGYWEWLGAADTPEVSLGIVQYDVSEMANPTNISNLKTTAQTADLWSPNGVGGHLLLQINPQGISAEERERNLFQAEQIRTAFGNIAQLDVVDNTSSQWGFDCTSAVLLVSAMVAIKVVPFITLDEAAVLELANTEKVVSTFEDKVAFDAAGEFVKSEEYKAAVDEVVASGELVNKIEVIAATEEALNTETEKFTRLMEAMKADGVAVPEVELVARVATVEEKAKLVNLSGESPVAMIMTKQ